MARDEHKKQNSRILYYAIIAAFFAIALAVCSLTVFFHIDKIYVTGDEVPYDDIEIIAISGVETDTNIIMQSTSNVSDKISEMMPHIASVEVIKHFPFEVELKVTAAEIIGQLEGVENFVLDRNGRCIEKSLELKPGAPVIRGTGVLNAEVGKTVSFGSSNALDDVVKMHDAFKKEGINSITVYNISDANQICATYENRIVINFGTSDNLDAKLEYAVQIIEQQKNGKQTGVLNLSRIPNDKQYAYFSPETLNESQIAYVLE